MEKFVCLLVCLAVFVHSGSAADSKLKCYMCGSDKLDGCTKAANPREQVCGNPDPGFQFVCYYKVAYDTTRKMNMVNSTCIQIAQNSPLDKTSIKDCQTPPTGVEIKECRVCNTDLCNSAPVFSTSLFTLLCLPVMYMFTKFVLF